MITMSKQEPPLNRLVFRYLDSVDLAKIDLAYKGRASHLKRTPTGERNQAWRTLEAERRMFASDEDQW